jgi:asparagine synthase (glutamine-hydrolysing)
MAPHIHSRLLSYSDDPAAQVAVLTWDGRADNRGDLLSRLRHSLTEDTSSAALVRAAYERWGIHGLATIIGDWSVVIDDPIRRAIVLASDFIGVRPLYYHRRGDRVLWSRRLDALVNDTGIDTIDEQYIAGFLMFGGYPHRTPYRDIHSVPPGHAVCITGDSTTVHRFWTLPIADVARYRDERRYDEQVRQLFREGVAARLQTDTPVAAELSGGLDSSSVVCVADSLIRSGAVTVPRLTTVSYLHEGSLDAPFIREVETSCGFESVHVSTDTAPVLAMDDLTGVTPAGSSPLVEAAATAARHVGATAFLTGQGGDLVMSNWFDDSLQVAGLIRRLRFDRACLEAFRWSRVVRRPMVSILARGLRAVLPAVSHSSSSSIYAVDGLLTGSADTSLLPEFSRRTGVADPHTVFSREWLQAPPERRVHFRSLTMMRELRTLQVPTAMDGLDYTHPFTHRPLVEFLLTVPADVLCRPGEPRRLMRRAFADLWPPQVRARKSKGLFGRQHFVVLMPLASKLLQEDQWQVVQRGWVSRRSLVSRLERLSHGLDCNLPQLCRIILLELWMRHRARRWPWSKLAA